MGRRERYNMTSARRIPEITHTFLDEEELVITLGTSLVLEFDANKMVQEL